MTLNLQEIWQKAGKATKSVHGQTVEEHFQPLRISSVRSKIQTVFRYIYLIAEGYENLIKEANEGSSADLVNLRLYYLRKGLHGAPAKDSGLKRSLRMLFYHNEFERKKLNKQLVAYFLASAIKQMLTETPTLQDKSVLAGFKSEFHQYFDASYISSELLEVPESYL